MKRDKFEARHTQQRASVEKFVPCETETMGGANHGGSTCAGGMRVYRATQFSDMRRKVPMYDAIQQREARTCECLLAWRERNPRTT